MLTAVEAGGDVRGRDDETGATPLHCAAELGRDEMIVRLIKAGADVDARDWEGATPLYRAVEKGWAESAGTLLKHGADPNFPDHEGRTPWGMAADAGREDMMGQFRDQEAKQDREREAMLQRTRQWLREPEAPRREEADWLETARIHGEAWERQRRAAFIRSIDHRVPVEERLDARRETEGWERRHPQEAAELKSAARAVERAERKPLPELTPAQRQEKIDARGRAAFVRSLDPAVAAAQPRIEREMGQDWKERHPQEARQLEQAAERARPEPQRGPDRDYGPSR